VKKILIGGILPILFAATALAPQQQQQTVAVQDRVPVARRIAATVQLAAQEYRIGVVDGRVTAPAEVEEARLFLEEAQRSVGLLPPEIGKPAAADIQAMLRLVGGAAPPDSLDARVRSLTGGLAERLGVALEEIPAHTPSLARGAEIYRSQCASCHGATGAGNGPQAPGLDPPPADLATATALRDVTPLDYFRRISIGTAGTAMPAFEGRLPAEDRWAVALYASTLRLPAAAGGVPSSLRSFATTAKLSDGQLLAKLGADTSDTAALARVAAVREFEADHGPASAEIFAAVRRQLDSAFALARTGSPDARARAFDAYMTSEQVERGVRA
jgi:high-affinity iron transporter